jgi:agmatine deiminase
MTWPGRPEVWHGYEQLAVAEYSALAVMISSDEELRIIWGGVSGGFGVPPSADGISRIVAPTDDSWIRDNGPIFAESAAGEVVALDFDFNAWGGRFEPYEHDDQVGAHVAAALGVPRRPISFVLEGGAVSFNGHGVAMVVEECVLHPSRNGPVERAEFEAVLAAECGVSDVIWLPFGLVEDLANTDGHVDNVAIFTSSGSVLMQIAEPTNANHERLNANLRAVEDWSASTAHPLTVRTISQLPYATFTDGSQQPSSFINLAVTNRSVILPFVGQEPDRSTHRVISQAFSGRFVRTTPSVALAWGGGGPHCVTMQVPAPAKRRAWAQQASRERLSCQSTNQSVLTSDVWGSAWRR